jgi:hypothetical protein
MRSLIYRIRTAYLAFRDPTAYWDGLNIRNVARELHLKERIAVIRPDSTTSIPDNYTIQYVDRGDHYLARQLFGW